LGTTKCSQADPRTDGYGADAMKVKAGVPEQLAPVSDSVKSGSLRARGQSVKITQLPG